MTTSLRFRFSVVTMALLSCLLAMGGAGCSTFNRDWKMATSQPVLADGVSGAWDGHWVSDRNAHTGRLRCLLTEQPGGTWQARFHAVYGKIFSFSYTAEFKMEPAAGGETKFRGGTDLGWWGGGAYGYDGSIRSTNFFSIYTNRYDHGTFQMHRPN